MASYEAEIARIMAFDEEESFEFEAKLLHECGRELRRGGGVIVTRSSCGPEVKGFAIDPVTLRFKITYSHQSTKSDLSADLAEYYGHADGAYKRCMRRVVGGLLFPKLEGFSNQIVQLWVVYSTKREIEAISKFFREGKMYIPVDSGGKLLWS